MLIKKLVIGLAVVAMVFSVSASAAHALTAADILQALQNDPSLVTTLQGLLGGGSSGSGSMMSSHTFTMNLTLGSSGSEVSALQQVLVDGGYLVMPAGVAMGHFGPLTKAAVMKWQAASGVSPASGNFGPLSRAALNASMVAVTPPPVYPPVTGLPAGCMGASGFSTMTGQPCSAAASTVPGCTSTAGFSSTTGQSCSAATTASGAVADGTDGSVILSYNSYAPASQTLKKGDMDKPVIGFKLQATNGRVVVSHIDLDFNSRPWLLFSKIVIKDVAGTVIGTKTLSGPSDATEVTVGSDYKVRVDGLSYIVTPGTDAIIHADVDVLAASDKITGQTVTVGLASDALRTTNGIGYGATLGLSTGTGAFAGTPNSIILSSTGSTGDIYSSISSNSPAIKRTVVTNSSSVTSDVVLGVYSLKSQNQNATINTLKFNLNGSNGSTAPGSANTFQNVRLITPDGTYGLSGAIATSSNAFTNMNLHLTQDQWVNVTLKADVLSGINGYTASSTLVGDNGGTSGTNIVGVDTNFNSLTTTNAANVTASDVAFSTSGLGVTGASVVPCVGVDNGSKASAICTTSYTFTLQNVGNTPLYISALAGTLVATSSTNSSSTISNAQTFTPSPGIIAGDIAGSYFILPANGAQSRTITLNGTIGAAAASGGFSEMKITKIYFGTATTALQASNIDFGLANLTQNYTFASQPGI